MPASVAVDTSAPVTASGLARCLGCATPIVGRSSCPSCGREYPTIDGLFHAIGPLTGTNRVAAAFYDGPAWVRFRPWERLFLAFQGPGQTKARRQVLRHLPRGRGLRVLEVGIGDGENLALLPPDWDVFGVDIARNPLGTCLRRFPRTSGRLAWAEGEALPFGDGVFDAVFTVGGINYFRDPSAALREMARVARPGETIVAADEIPDLHRFGLGSVLGLEGLDRWWLRVSGLDPEFIAMVFETPALVEPAAARAWPGHVRVPIWNRLGYCLVHQVRADEPGANA
jgi:SAM-dependent methyltransferase